jgi:hypothetical protein
VAPGSCRSNGLPSDHELTRRADRRSHALRFGERVARRFPLVRSQSARRSPRRRRPRFRGTSRSTPAYVLLDVGRTMSRAELCPVVAALPEVALRSAARAGHSNPQCRVSNRQGDNLEAYLQRHAGPRADGKPGRCRQDDKLLAVSQEPVDGGRLCPAMHHRHPTRD